MLQSVVVGLLYFKGNSFVVVAVVGDYEGSSYSLGPNISQNGDSQTTETNSSQYWRGSESPRSDVVRLGVF